MRVLIVEPEQRPKEKEIDNSLTAMQKIVGPAQRQRQSGMTGPVPGCRISAPRHYRQAEIENYLMCQNRNNAIGDGEDERNA